MATSTTPVTWRSFADRFRHPWLSPDGARYREMAQGAVLPRPFRDRWLLPWALGAEPLVWRITTCIALVGIVVVTGAWAHALHDSWVAAAAAALVIAQCPGVIDVHVRLPVLVDPVAMLLALDSAYLAWSGRPLAAVAVALVAGAAKETAPVFAAAWSLSPWPLVGLAAPLVTRVLLRSGEDLDQYRVGVAGEALRHPWRTSVAVEANRWRSFERWAGPWGVGLVGFFWPGAWLALAVGYAQCALATDRTRLYQWAAPSVALGVAAYVHDPSWLVPLAALALWRPWPGDGI